MTSALFAVGRQVERVLIRLDAPPFDAVVRLLIGLAIVPVAEAMSARDGSTLSVIECLFAVLIAMRAVPAVLRHVLPFSAEASEVWWQRRLIAKRYDSYQWRKLFWIGIGLAVGEFLFDAAQAGRVVVAATCVLGGFGGLLAWHRGGARACEAREPARREVRSAW